MNPSEDRPSSAVKPDKRLATWFLLLLAMIALAYYNFSLLSGQMEGHAGGRSLVFGITSRANVAAVLLVGMELLAGLYFLENWGVTKSVSAIQEVEGPARKWLQRAWLILLLTFAGIQAGLAFDVDPPSNGVPLAGIRLWSQTVIAFVIPFALLLAPLSAIHVVMALRDRHP